MTISMVLWVGAGTPTVYAQLQQEEPNRTLLLQNLKNGTINDDMMGLMIVCNDFLDDPDVNESVLKDCDHQALYYYGVCEEVAGPDLNKGNITSDCYGAEMYTSLRNLTLEPRPHNWIPN